MAKPFKEKKEKRLKIATYRKAKLFVECNVVNFLEDPSQHERYIAPLHAYQ